MTTTRHSKRDDLVTAALRLFSAQSIAGTSVREIAQAAGVTEGALYRHFASKEALAQALFAESARMLHEHLQAAVDEADTAQGQLCSVARAFVDFAQSQPEAYEYVMARHYERVGELPPDQPLPKEVVVGVLRRGMAGGEFRRMDAQLGAAMVIGLLMRTIFFRQRGLIELSLDEMQSEVCGAIRRVFEVQ